MKSLQWKSLTGMETLEVRASFFCSSLFGLPGTSSASPEPEKNLRGQQELFHVKVKLHAFARRPAPVVVSQPQRATQKILFGRPLMAMKVWLLSMTFRLMTGWPPGKPPCGEELKPLT